MTLARIEGPRARRTRIAQLCGGLALAGALLPAAAWSATGGEDEPGFFVGAGIGYNRIESEDFPNDADELHDSHESYKAIAGYRFSRAIAVEGQYINFGTAEDGLNRVKADGFTLDAVVRIPVWESVNPYAKIGALMWDADGRSGGPAPAPVINASDDGTDLTYGLGIQFNLGERLALRTEYERFELSDTHVDMGSANFVYNF